MSWTHILRFNLNLKLLPFPSSFSMDFKGKVKESEEYGSCLGLKFLEVVEDVVACVLVEAMPVVFDANILGGTAEENQESCMEQKGDR